MSNPFFRFKQFTVYHDKCSHKVGFDGVTLGAWCDVKDCTRILDIGTGSGLIALMLAQRSNAQITAIELDKNSIEQAKENFKRSVWNDRIVGHHIALQDFVRQTDDRFDLIVSNPPFFENSLKAKGVGRSNARHTDSLSQDELIDSVSRLLLPKGRFCVILPVTEADRLVQKAEKKELYCNQRTELSPTPTKEVKRVLLEFSHIKTELLKIQLIVEEDRHVYTQAYQELVKDFYLKL